MQLNTHEQAPLPYANEPSIKITLQEMKRQEVKQCSVWLTGDITQNVSQNSKAFSKSTSLPKSITRSFRSNCITVSLRRVKYGSRLLQLYLIKNGDADVNIHQMRVYVTWGNSVGLIAGVNIMSTICLPSILILTTKPDLDVWWRTSPPKLWFSLLDQDQNYIFVL